MKPEDLQAVSHWRIFTDASKPESAEKVARTLLKKLDRSDVEFDLEPYHKGGFEVSFDLPLASNDSAKKIEETIALAQMVARSWTLTGLITEELDLWSSKSSQSGVTDLHVRVTMYRP